MIAFHSGDFRIRVFNETGDLQHQFDSPTDENGVPIEFYAITSCKQFIYFTLPNGIVSWDTITGESKEIVRVEGDTSDARAVGVCHGKLLVYLSELNGIFVFDLEHECSVNPWLDSQQYSEYSHLMQSTENSSIFYATLVSDRISFPNNFLNRNQGEVHVLEMSAEGKLSFIYSLPEIQSFPNTKERIPLSKLQGYLFPYYSRLLDRLIVTWGGKDENSFVGPNGDLIDAIVRHGTEMFVALNTDHAYDESLDDIWDDSIPFTGQLVVAFLANSLA